TPRPGHIANLQSAPSGVPTAVRWPEVCSASRSQFPGQKRGSFFQRTVTENPMLCSGFAFRSWQPPVVPGKCITVARARRVSKVAELTDLSWDGGRRERSLNHTASVRLPYLR